MKRGRARGRRRRGGGIALAAALWLAATSAATGAPDRVDPDGPDRLERWVTAYADARSLDGVVRVSRAGRLLVHRAFGTAQREFDVPNRPDTRFHIASVTKPITAAATLALVDAGRLSLDDTVARHVGWYRADTGSRITIHNLLSHTSGLPNFATREFWEGPAPRLDWNRRAFLEEHGQGDLLFEPGADALYSDENYFLLATILERVTGLTFPEILERHVFAPLEMDGSEAATGRGVHPRVASSYVVRRGEVMRPDPIQYADVQPGAGDVISTAEDLDRFARALRGDGFLSAGMRERMFEAIAPSGFPGQMQGYGWNLGTVDTDAGPVAVAHAPGNNGGNNALLYLLPESGTTIVILLNAGTPWLDGRLYELAEASARVLAGDDVPLPLPSALPALRRAMEQEGAHAGLTYRALVQSAAFDPDRRGANRLGYEWMHAGALPAAISLFEAVVETFPEEWNAHDSLAEAYYNDRRLEAALEHYRKSVALNPENENGKRMIELLQAKR